ncbi:MAG: hypothetical protein IJT38_05550 [Clostridia bacterium]|nr:hypothetical protein [Clostridia bacterium]
MKNKEELIQKLSAVINALDNVEVKGRVNLMNLSGCIALLDEVCQDIVNMDNADDTGKAEKQTSLKR